MQEDLKQDPAESQKLVESLDSTESHEIAQPDEDLERIAREMDTPAKKFARWDEKKRQLFERAVGFALGAVAGLCLIFIPAGESFFSLNIVIPLVLALAVPRVMETQFQAQLKELRKYMIIALGAFVVIMGIMAVTGNVPSFYRA